MIVRGLFLTGAMLAVLVIAPAAPACSLCNGKLTRSPTLRNWPLRSSMRPLSTVFVRSPSARTSTLL